MSAPPDSKNAHPGEPGTGSSRDSLTDMLNASYRIRERLFELCEDATDEGNDAALRFLIPLHSRAVISAFKLKKAHDKEQERRSVLVEKHPIIEGCRRSIETMIRRIRTLPTECGPLWNPQESLKAVAILERAVAEVIAAGRRALIELAPDESNDAATVGSANTKLRPAE